MRHHLSWWPFSAYPSYKPVSLIDNELFDDDDELTVEDHHQLHNSSASADKFFTIGGGSKMGKQSVNIATTMEFQQYEVSFIIILCSINFFVYCGDLVIKMSTTL